MPFYVLKLGGSLISSARDLVRALLHLSGEGFSFLVVPGGGPMADLVRRIDSREGLSDDAAHWMAVLAMEQYARFLADGTGALLTDEIARPDAGPGVRILLPYTALLKDDSGLEHNWENTSDSIALLVASRLAAPLIKATDVDGVILDGRLMPQLMASQLLGRESCLDQGSVRMLCCQMSAMSIRILNGTDSRRFVESLKNERGGTIVSGDGQAQPLTESRPN